jgi:hypothetical protein
LTQALTQVVQQGETILANREANVAAGTKGFYIEFTLPEAQADIVDKLENRRGKFPIELVNVRAADAGQVFATVFVPEKQKEDLAGSMDALRWKSPRMPLAYNRNLAAEQGAAGRLMAKIG